MEQGRPNNIEKQQMSEEELQRTQVLNLDDFRNIARIERIGSKKPAILVSVVGLLLIILGTTFPAIQSYNARKEAAKKEHIVAARYEEDEEPEEKELVCTLVNKNQFGGADEYLKITYKFEDDILKTAEKEYQIVRANPSVDVPFIAQFKSAMPQYLVQSEGYSITPKDIENGVMYTTKIDYETLDLTKVPDFNKGNFRFNTEFTKGTKAEDVKKTKIGSGYECK